MSTGARDELTSAQVADAAGITYRQLDYWCRTGVLGPSVTDANGSGSRRRFTLRDALVAAAVGKLAETGMRCSTMGTLAGELGARDRFEGLLFASPDGVVTATLPSPAIPLCWVLDLDALRREVLARVTQGEYAPVT